MGEGDEEANKKEFAVIAEATGLDVEQIDSLKKGFEGFDKEGGGTISQTSMQMILKSMGVKVDKDDMESHCSDVDEEATGKFSFHMFCQVAARFMIEVRLLYLERSFNKYILIEYFLKDDEEQMKEELKEAFRIYDKENQGFITNEVLKEILREIDPTLTEDDLEGIIEEVDEDGSGTMDFDEFQEMMMG